MEPIYLLFTAAMVVASLGCLWDARGDSEGLTLYGTAVVYGLILEKLVIVAFGAYTYPAESYALSVFGVPLAIAFGWSAVIYAGTTTARAYEVPLPALPGFVALYALHVDLSMDAVAIRVPFWTWTPPGPWFGVPLGNFFGWFCVAFLFAGWFELLRRRVDHPLALGAGTLGASLLTLLAALEVWTHLVHSVALGTGILLCLGVLSALGLVRFRPSFAGLPARTAAGATLLFHVFFVGVLLWTGTYRTTPPLAVVSVAALGVGVAVHAVPERELTRRRRTRRESRR
ncbi:MAG: carotenoid biosynthesis protein [Haloplanus sp.]